MSGDQDLRTSVRDATRDLAVAQANLGELMSIFPTVIELSVAAELADQARLALLRTADALDRRDSL